MKSMIGVFAVLILVGLTIGGFAVEYTVEFWGSYFRNVPVDVPFWACMIAGAFIGTIAIPVAVVTWLLSFVLL